MSCGLRFTLDPFLSESCSLNSKIKFRNFRETNWFFLDGLKAGSPVGSRSV